MNKFFTAASILLLTACYIEPTPGPPPPPPSSGGYYECAADAYCDGYYIGVLYYSGCANSATAAANDTAAQCVSTLLYGGYNCYSAYCESYCSGGSASCRTDDPAIEPGRGDLVDIDTAIEHSYAASDEGL